MQVSVPMARDSIIPFKVSVFFSILPPTIIALEEKIKDCNGCCNLDALSKHQRMLLRNTPCQEWLRNITADAFFSFRERIISGFQSIRANLRHKICGIAELFYFFPVVCRYEKAELHEMQEELEDVRDCGLSGFRPKFLQPLASIKVRYETMS